MSKITRKQYADLFGPTTGDKIRLGDTDLFIEIERDLRVIGDEIIYGGGKTLRDGMGSDNKLTQAAGCLDMVITNVTVLDPFLGVVKADVGIRDGKIVGVGKAGNPSTMDGVTPGLATGTSTDAISGEHLILTAAGMDTHVHYICPQQVWAALSNGITTFWGGGIGPSDGTNGVTTTNGPWNLEMMLRAAEGLPINFGFQGKGNSSSPEPLIEQLEAGAAGFKIHEDYGTTPAAIRSCLRVADEYDVSVAVHTDTLNESGFVEDSIAAFDGRTIHTYHSEGAGGGHAPDLLKVVGQRNVLPSSTNPTLPCGVNSVAELFDMIMVCHNLNPKVPSDVSFAESRVRAETIVAESVLHDMGAISMIGSDCAGDGPSRRELAPHHPDRRHHEEDPRPSAGRLQEQRQFPRTPVRGQGHDQSHHHRRHLRRPGLDRPGEDGRPRALGARVLRRQTENGPEGGDDRLGEHGRPQRLAADHAAHATTAPSSARWARPSPGTASRSSRRPPTTARSVKSTVSRRSSGRSTARGPLARAT